MRLLTGISLLIAFNLSPRSASAALTVQQVMTLYGVSEAVAQQVVDTAGPFFNDDFETVTPASTNNPNAPYDPVEGDLGRAQKALEAANFAMVGYGGTFGRGGALIGIGATLGALSFTMGPGGTLIMNPVAVEAGSVLTQMGMTMMEQAAHFNASQSPNRAQYMLLTADLGQSGGAAAVQTGSGSSLSAPKTNEPSGALFSGGAIGLFEGMGVDIDALKALVSEGNIQGAANLIQDSVKSAGLGIEAGLSGGELVEAFLSATGSSDFLIVDRKAPGGNALGGNARGGNAPGGQAPGGDVPGGDAPGKDAVEDPDAENIRYGRVFGINEDNFGAAPARPGGMLGDRAPRARMAPESIQIRASLRMDPAKLNALGLVIVVPGSTIFDVARDTYRSWDRYRNGVVVARHP